MGDLSARLMGLIGKTVTEEDMQDLAVAIADALDAAPPPERVLPEGRKWETCSECDGEGGFMIDSMEAYGIPGGIVPGPMCPNCYGSGVIVRWAIPVPTDDRVPYAPTAAEVAALDEYAAGIRAALSPDSGADPEPQP